MTSRIRSTWALSGLLLWLAAGCGGSNGGSDGTGGATLTGTGGATIAGTGGATIAGTGGATIAGTGGATPGTGGAGTGGSGAGGRADGGATDAAGSDAASGDVRPADTGAADTRSPDAGGSDATIPFAPCPATGPCIVMPLGDSITEGYPTFMGGYRVELFHDANINGKNITFVGRRNRIDTDGGVILVDGVPLPRGSEGYSGYTIDTAPGFTGISPLTVPAINMFHPHIILLAIGTNDINGNLNIATAPTRLGALMDTITTAAPNTLLVVAQIIPTRTDATNTRIMAYNAAIPALVQARANAGKHVLIVNMYGTFTANANYKTALLVDDLHPNPAGYGLMGRTWYGVIAPYLP